MISKTKTDKKKERANNIDPYLKNNQELRSGVPAAKSRRNDELGFSNHGDKMDMEEGENSLAWRGLRSMAPARQQERGEA
jgi:hypothetical protein